MIVFAFMFLPLRPTERRPAASGLFRLPMFRQFFGERFGVLRPPPSFSVMSSPCIAVLVREDADREEVSDLLAGAAPGEVVRVTVLQALVGAHLIADLQVPHVAVEAALRRFLTALVVRVTGLDTPDEHEWERVQESALLAGRFDADAVTGYVGRFPGRFDLYGTPLPLLQDPRLAAECTKASPPGRLAMTRPSGNTQPWRSRVPQEVPVASADAFGWLLAWRDYGPCGMAALRSHGGESTKSSKAGPNRRTVSYFPLGEDLFTSLVLGCPPPSRWPQLPGEDMAPWEREELPDPLAPVAACGPVSLLTGRAAHAVQLAPGADGAETTSCWIAWGTRTDLPVAADPFTMTTSAGKARLANAGRSLLRDFDALAHATDVSASGKVSSVPPVWLSAFAGLPPKVLDVLSGVRVRVLGCQQAAQAGGMEHWWAETTPVSIAPYLPSRDPQRSALVSRTRKAAEDAAKALGAALRAAWRDMGSNPKQNAWADAADAAFWDRAEAPFWAAVAGRDGEDGKPASPGFRRIALQVYDAVTAPQAATAEGMDPIAVHRRSVISPPSSGRRKADPVSADSAPSSAPATPPASNRPNPLEVFDGFLRLVAKVCSTPGGRARLADGLACDLTEGAPFHVVEALLDAAPSSDVRKRIVDPQQARLFILIACLYAFHDAPNPRTAGERRHRPPRPGFLRHNLGWTYREAVNRGTRAGNARDALLSLAGLELDDLVLALPGAISQLRSQKVPVTWSVLLRDLTRWPRHADAIRLEWIHAFHPATASKENAA
ncbi:type I-E CRISPR-associated protein Cse1/CasA [Kitasatospora sp. NRRL B-11411]|uniref:type I-E CRISPR-associated protein Cse1/CasA n=1 Tax=Kitasatospora sp. NRRL B-11411 TaxID=1463822 RepID=UPI0018E2B8CB|nr:type I-E CRISPR-associated protein Cse1/CasA [Kitasatospora sp. NRRL B-11411]